MKTSKPKSTSKPKVKKVNGAIINGVKYNRETDFARDTADQIVRKYKKYTTYHEKMKEILKRRLPKIEAKEPKNEKLIKAIEEILKK